MLVLVLGRTQPASAAVDTDVMFDHEKLDAYNLAIEFVAWVTAFFDEAHPTGRPSAVKHLDEASASVALNIAEGNGKRSVADRVRYLEIDRGSALECAACIDVLVVRKRLSPETARIGKLTLVRVVSTITKLIEKLLERASTSTSTSTGPGPSSRPGR